MYIKNIRIISEGIVTSVNLMYKPYDAELNLEDTFAANYRLSLSDLSDPHIVKAIYRPKISYEMVKESSIDKNEDYK